MGKETFHDKGGVEYVFAYPSLPHRLTSSVATPHPRVLGVQFASAGSYAMEERKPAALTRSKWATRRHARVRTVVSYRMVIALDM